MTDLIEFLNARLDEDDEIARLADAVDPSPWYEDVEDDSYTRQREGLDSVGLVRAADNVGLWDREQSSALSMAGVTATHAARHDPARVLREVDAKRRILAEVVPEMDGMTRQIHMEWGVGPLDPSTHESLGLLRLLALPYADHPDYQQEWTP